MHQKHHHTLHVTGRDRQLLPVVSSGDEDSFDEWWDLHIGNFCQSCDSGDDEALRAKGERLIEHAASWGDDVMDGFVDDLREVVAAIGRHR